MFFKLVRKNGKKVRRENSIFFVSLIVAVIAFYIFLSLEDQDVIVFLKSMESDAVGKLLALLPVFYDVSLFLLFFLVYFSGLYQLERRKYELGVYLMLGMKRSRLFLLLLAEDIWNSLISLVIGIPVAVFFSEMISLITSKTVGLGIIGHHFSFSLEAVLLTAAGFAGIKLAAFAILSGKMVHREIQYYFQDEEAIEQKKGGTGSYLRLGAGVLCLAGAYALAISGIAWAELIFMGATVILGLIGMFLVFSGLGTVLERFWKGRKKGLGIFTSRQLTEQISIQWKPLTVASLLFLAAFCLLGYGISAASTLKSQNASHGADFTFQGEEADIRAVLKKTGAEQYLDEIYEMRLSMMMSDDIWEEDYPEYVHDFSWGTVLESAGKLSDQNERTILENNLSYRTDPYLIALSGYNQVLKAEGKEPITLGKDQVAIYKDPQLRTSPAGSGMKKILEDPQEITIDGKNYSLYGTVCFEPLVADRIITLDDALIVPDELFEQLTGPDPESYWNVKLKQDYVEQEGLMQAVYTVNEMLKDTGLTYESYLQSMGRQLFYNVASSYLTLYLAVILLVIANTVISVQFLMHQRKTGRRCGILSLLGAGYDMLCDSAETQVQWYFMVPLATAVVNSCFGLPSLITGIGTIGTGTGFLLSGLVVIAGVFVIEWVYMRAVMHLNNRQLLYLIRQAEESQERL